jgi:Cu-Zn family superoxide dismutase
MQADAVYAICILKPDLNSGVSGVVRFVQPAGGRTIVNASIKGLSAGKHGFHVHEFGNLTEGCKTAGAHYNPTKKTHGAPFDTERHVGDMGNVVSDGKSESIMVYEDPLIELSGAQRIIGRAVVVHADEDDLGRGGHDDSKTTGHAGSRVACGVIGISSAFEFAKPQAGLEGCSCRLL